MKKFSILDQLANSIWVNDFLVATIKSCVLLIAASVGGLFILCFILEIIK